MPFSDKLIALRKARGLSQEDLASELELSRQAVGKWESGQSLPETEKIPAIAEFFGVTTDYLLTDKASGSQQGNLHVQVEAKPKPRASYSGLASIIIGVLIDLAVIIAAAINLPTINAWSTAYPSKLWFLIFAGSSRYNDGADGLGLGWVFFSGIALVFFGAALSIRDVAKRKR